MAQAITPEMQAPSATLSELEYAARYAATLERDWRTFLSALFPDHTRHPFSEHQAEFWEWLWSIEADKPPDPATFVAVWPRGQGKSTNAELAVVALGARKIRGYVLYVCATQDQADDHVTNIAALLESDAVQAAYPELGTPKIGRHGNRQGWKRNRLRTASGLTVDAVGLDSAARGAKIDDLRPGLIILDDVDAEHDSDDTVTKKIKSITRKLIPAGAENLAVLFVQNVVHGRSVMARMVDDTADFLRDRHVSGPVPAIENLVIEDIEGRPTITGGAATWAGMPIARCQEILDAEGYAAFMVERQHDTSEAGQNIFKPWWWDNNRYDPLDRRYFTATTLRWASLDSANKATQTSAYSSLGVFELRPDHRLPIRDVRRERLEFPDLFDFTIEMLTPYAFDDKFRGIVIEDAASGTQLIQSLRRSGPPWLRRKVIDVKPNPAGKEASWKAAAHWLKRGMMPLPYPADEVEWLGVYEDELFQVPKTDYKDQADMTAQIINYLESRHHVFSKRWRMLMERSRHDSQARVERIGSVA